MLKPITMRAQTNPDGSLDLHVPTGLHGEDVDVVVVVQPAGAGPDKEDLDELGWPPGFFERTYGCLAGSGLKRWPQGEYEERDPIE